MTRDTGTSAGTATEIPHSRWGAVLAVSLAIVLAALDLATVAVALPLVGSVGPAAGGLSWTLTGGA